MRLLVVGRAVENVAIIRCHRFLVFFLVSSGWVGLCPLGTSATNWPTVPAPDDR
jgi:hypothetical protein